MSDDGQRSSITSCSTCDFVVHSTYEKLARGKFITEDTTLDDLDCSVTVSPSAITITTSAGAPLLLHFHSEVCFTPALSIYGDYNPTLPQTPQSTPRELKARKICNMTGVNGDMSFERLCQILRQIEDQVIAKARNVLSQPTVNHVVQEYRRSTDTSVNVTTHIKTVRSLFSFGTPQVVSVNRNQDFRGWIMNVTTTNPRLSYDINKQPDLRRYTHPTTSSRNEALGDSAAIRAGSHGITTIRLGAYIRMPNRYTTTHAPEIGLRPELIRFGLIHGANDISIAPVEQLSNPDTGLNDDSDDTVESVHARVNRALSSRDDTPPPPPALVPPQVRSPVSEISDNPPSDVPMEDLGPISSQPTPRVLKAKKRVPKA